MTLRPGARNRRAPMAVCPAGLGSARLGSAGLRALAAWLLCTVASLAGPWLAPAAAAVRIHPGSGQVDLLLMGFAVLQTDLTADLERFFDSSDQLPADFANRQMLNVRLDGQLGQPIALDARLQYDRENLRDWRYRVRLEGSHGALAIGEVDGAFQDNRFLTYDTPFYGARAQATLGRVTTGAFLTAQEGARRLDRLPGNNLSGPYLLSANPVLEGSERIALEVRDRRDPEQLVRSDAQRRGADYTIDYPTGSILFVEPIERETFDGDPVFVVVEYQFVGSLAGNGSGDDAQLTGARLIARPLTGLELGATVLSATGSGSTLADDGLIGFDQRLDVGRWLRLTSEIAGPRGAVTDRRRGAFRSGLELRPSPGLQLRFGFERVGPDFEIAANPTLDTVLDRQSLEGHLVFNPTPAHRFSAGAIAKSDDVADDPDRAPTRTRLAYAGWEASIEGWPLLRLRADRRTSDGPGSFGAGTATIDAVSFELEDDLGAWPLVGPAALRARYRFEQTDEGAAAGDRTTHGLAARFDFAPRPQLESWLELRGEQTDGDALADPSQLMEVVAGSRFRLPATLSLGASLRLRNRHDGLDGTDDRRRSLSLDVLYEPSPRLRAALKYEWLLAGLAGDDDGDAGEDAASHNLYARLAAQPIQALQLSLGYQLDDQATLFATSERNRTDLYFANVVYTPGERLTLFGRSERGHSAERLAPFPVTVVDRQTWLTGVSLDVTDRWQATAQYKDEQFTGPFEAHRRVMVFELSRSLSRYLRLGGGVALAIDEEGEVRRLDNQRLYMKLVGRL